MSTQEAQSKWRVGIVCLLVATCIWAGASVLTQYIYEDLGLHSPFMMTWIANSLFIVYLPLWQLWIFLGLVKSNPRFGSFSTLTQMPTFSTSTIVSASASASASAINNNLSVVNNKNGVGIQQDDHSAGQIDRKNLYTHMHAIRAALIISPLYFLANCLYNYSLYMTSVSSSTIISNLAASFTLLFAWLAGLEKITLPKVAGLLLCFCGALAVGLNDAESKKSSGDEDVPRSVSGDIVALLAAAGYGAYTTIIRIQIPDEDGVSMQLVLGYVGLIVFIPFLPFVIFSLVVGVGGLQMGVTWTALGFIILGGFADNVFSDYLWARAVVLTSPTVATVGMSITIPFAMISDLLLQKTKGMSVGSVIGAFLVICGFCLVNVDAESLTAAFGSSFADGGARINSASTHNLLHEASSDFQSPLHQREGVAGASSLDNDSPEEGLRETNSDDSDANSDTALYVMRR